jgi:hypothetical protein
MVLDGHSSLELTIDDNFNLTIGVGHNDDFTLLVFPGFHGSDEGLSFRARDCLQRSWDVHVANVHESSELALSRYEVLLGSILSIERNDGPERCRLPDVLLLFFFWGKLTTQPHTALFLFFLWVLLLIFLHLELHDFDAPLFDLSIVPVIGLSVVDFLLRRSSNLIDETIVTSENNSFVIVSEEGIVDLGVS